jgi:tetratricopeptide (TPR) repeat protein
MSQRFGPVLRRLRRLLLAGTYAAGVLYFWLGAHEVFEGPKTQAALFYGLGLAALSVPLLSARLAWAWRRYRQALQVGGLLVAATLLSWAGGFFALPGNFALSFERSLPVLLSAFAVLVWLLEDREQQDAVLFTVQGIHWTLLLYGLLQLLDQNWGQAHGVAVDVIRWVRFGESRVYSTLGNPDYMAAHLSLWGALWLGLGWRRADPRGPAQAAALALLAAPLFLVPSLYNQAQVGAIFQAMGPWALLCVGTFLLVRRLSARAVWALGLSLLLLLIIAAQGRGAWIATAASIAAMAAAAWALGGADFFRQRWQTLRWPLGAAVGGILLLLGLSAARAAQPQAAWAKQGAAGKALAALDSAAYRVTHIFDKANDAQVVRRFYWRAAWQMGLEHPLLGVGYGNHAMLTARAQSTVWKAWDAAGDPRALMVEPHVELYTHNDLLQNFAETGLLGLAAFLLFWAWFGREAWRLAKAGREAGNAAQFHLGLGLLGLLAAFAANAMTNFPWRVMATQQLCWLAAALLAFHRAPVEAEAAPAVPAPRTEGLVLALVVAAWASLTPLRWFDASLFIKLGDAYKDAAGGPQPAGGILFYERARQAGMSGTQQVETLLYLGSLYNQAGQSDKALEIFDEATRLYPDFLEAWYNIGFTWQNRFNSSHLQGDLDKAIAAYQHVLDVDPRAGNALNNLGNLRYQLGQLDQALEIYQRLLRYNPQSLEGGYNLAATYVRLGQREPAEAVLRQTLAQKADFAPAVQLYQQLQRLPKGYKLPKH